MWQGSIAGTVFENRGLLPQAQEKSRFFQIKAKAVKKVASASKMLALTYYVAVDLCKVELGPVHPQREAGEDGFQRPDTN